MCGISKKTKQSRTRAIKRIIVTQPPCMFNKSYTVSHRDPNSSVCPEPVSEEMVAGSISRNGCQSPTPRSARPDLSPHSVNRQLSLVEIWEYCEKAKKKELERRKQQARDRNKRLLERRFN